MDDKTILQDSAAESFQLLSLVEQACACNQSTPKLLLLQTFLREPIPVACNWHIAIVPESEYQVSKPSRVGIPQIKGAIAIDSDSVCPVAIPIARYWLIPCQTIIKRDVGIAACIAIPEI